MAIQVQTGFVGITYPLEHMRIGWQRYGGTVTASSAAAGFPAGDALTDLTYTGWKPTGATGSWTLTFDSPQEVSYVGIGAHTIGTSRAGVGVSFPDGSGGWPPIPGLFTRPEDNAALMFLFAPVTVSAIRVYVSDPGGAVAPRIGHIRAGPVMEWPRPCVYTGTPISDAREITYRDNISDAGEWQGREVISKGIPFTLQVNHLSEDWIASDYAPFRKYCDTGGQTFFVAPRPTSRYLDDVAYAKPASPLQAPREIPNYRISRSVTMQLKGHARVV